MRLPRLGGRQCVRVDVVQSRVYCQCMRDARMERSPLTDADRINLDLRSTLRPQASLVCRICCTLLTTTPVNSLRCEAYCIATGT